MSNKFYTDVEIKADIILDNETASTVPVLDGSKAIVSSAVTSTELGYVSGVTSAIQTQINAKASQTALDNHINDTTDAHDASAISVSPSGNLAADDVQEALVELQGDIDGLDTRLDAVEPDVADLVTLSGVAANSTTLGTFTGATIPDSSTIKGALQSLETALEALPDPITYEGTWDASTNTPTLADGVGNVGDLYQVTVAGTVDFGAGNIVFSIGDKVVYNGTVWEKWDMTDAVSSVFGRTGAVTAQSGDYNTSLVTENTNLYFTDERAQDAVGTILVDSASIDFTYNDGTPSITAAVLPAGVDHDALQNFVANEHIDHSSVSIATASSTSGLSGGGDITTTRNLVVDITGTTALSATPDNADELLIWDSSASVRRKVTVAELLAGVDVGSAGDINETSFSIANNQTSEANITGFAFSNAVVRSFKALVSVEIDAASDLFEVFTLEGIQRGTDWQMSISGTGDDSLIVFSITTAGQVQYTSGNYTTFSSGSIKFRAITTTV